MRIKSCVLSWCSPFGHASLVGVGVGRGSEWAGNTANNYQHRDHIHNYDDNHDNYNHHQ